MTDTKISSSWHSMGKVYHLGHATIRELLEDDVVVQEKVDGSQFSFGKFGGELRCRSKGVVQNLDAPDKMFGPAIDVVRALEPVLVDGWTYRGEYLQKPKHNALAYDRIPQKHIILFDILTAEETYLNPEVVDIKARELGLEAVPCFFKGKLTSAKVLQDLLNSVSCLGGAKVEGVVVKNYQRFTKDGKAMMGKYVSEAFKEIHKGAWKESNPGQKDILEKIADAISTPARYQKAVIHLKEKDALKGQPSDIGQLIVELKNDIEVECSDYISTKLLKWAMPHILRKAVGGLPEWYKGELLKEQFGGETPFVPTVLEEMYVPDPDPADEVNA